MKIAEQALICTVAYLPKRLRLSYEHQSTRISFFLPLQQPLTVNFQSARVQ